MMRPRQLEVSESRAALEREAQELSERLFGLMAKANSHGLLDSDDLRRAKRDRKLRFGIRSDHSLQKQIQRLRTSIESLTAKLADVTPIAAENVGALEMATTASAVMVPAHHTPAREDPRDHRPKRLDELHDKEKVSLTLRITAATYLRQGYSAPEVLERLAPMMEEHGVSRSAEWVRKIGSKAIEGDISSLFDRRARNRRAPKYPDEMKQRLTELWLALPAATAWALWEALRDWVKSERPEYPVPTWPWVRSVLNAQPKAMRIIRKQGVRGYKKSAMPRLAMPTPASPGEVYQIDHTPLDILVGRPDSDGVMIPTRPHLTTVQDLHSRAIVGLHLSCAHANTQSCQLAMYDAMTDSDVLRGVFGGVPERLVTDRGLDFMSSDFERSMALMSVQLVRCKPYTPDQKAHVERMFTTITQSLSAQPGYLRNQNKGIQAETGSEFLLTEAELENRIREWVRTTYNTTPHGDTGSSPADLWITGRPPRRAKEEERNLMLLSERSRSVGKSGIRFLGMRFQASCLQHHFGRTVEIKFFPGETDVIYAYDALTGAYLGPVPRINTPFYDAEKHAIAEAQREGLTAAASHAKRATETLRATRRQTKKEAEATRAAIREMEKPLEAVPPDTEMDRDFNDFFGKGSV